MTSHVSKDAVPNLIKVLAMTKPELFSFEKPVPFKIGIREDLIAALPDIKNRVIKRAIYRMTNRSLYLLACCTVGAPRYGLNGPEGEITEVQAAHAKKMLRLRKSPLYPGPKSDLYPPADIDTNAPSAID